MSDSSYKTPGMQHLDKYELVEQLGHGGAAEVWKALDTQLQRYVAIKLLHPNLRDDPNFIARFQREAQLIASLHHPNIVQIHDFQVFQAAAPDRSSITPMFYMVMDYVEGQTLADYIRNTSGRGQFPAPAEIVGLFTSIALAVDHAHQKGMIHRDIKPANILLDKNNTTHNAMGEPILTDFGVAKLMGASTTMMTMLGLQLGTPLYISPEQARGRPGNESSDLYSLGVILYEILTGVTPFRGDTALDILTQQIHTIPTSPALLNSRIPPAVERVIMCNLAKDPAQRFPSAMAMVAFLADALNVPVPESVRQSLYPPDPMQMPTHLTPLPLSTSSELMTPSLSGGAVPPSSQVGAISGGSPTSTPRTPSIPFGGIGPVRASAPPPIPPPVHNGRPDKRWLYVALLSLVVLGAALGAYFVSIGPPRPVVGRAFYTSSGQLNLATARTQAGSEGIADQIQIDLQNISAPQAGNAYYVWLLGDKRPEPHSDLLEPRPIHPPVLLTNNLPVQDGAVHYFYAGDTNHDNLLSTVSRLLITEEAAGNQLQAPSPDRSTWRYYAEIPQAQILPDTPDNDGFSALVHIRHLFYNETNIQVAGLYGGLDAWMFRNTEKVLEWAVSARDDWHGPNTAPVQMSLMGDQFIRILDYLDGSSNVHIDVPPGTPLLADADISRVSLLTVDTTSPQGQVPANFKNDPPGYVDHVQLHVGQVAQAPDVTDQMRNRCARILDAMNNIKGWLTKVHQDALRLFQISNDPAQFMLPSTAQLLDEMVTQATYAYIGELDPTTNLVRPGMLQAHYDIQQLATMTVTSTLPSSL